MNRKVTDDINRQNIDKTPNCATNQKGDFMWCFSPIWVDVTCAVIGQYLAVSCHVIGPLHSEWCMWLASLWSSNITGFGVIVCLYM